MYDIIKDAPMPATSPRAKGMGRVPIYPLAQLEVGQAFDVPIDRWKSVRQAASVYAKRNPGVRFTTRVQKDGQTVRCWRIA